MSSYARGSLSFIAYSLSRRYKKSNTYLERSFGAVKVPMTDEKPLDSGTV